MPTYHPGRNALLKYGSGSPPSYATVGGMRNTTLDITASPVDVTNKDSAGQQAMLANAGVWKGSISGQGLFDNTSTPLKALIAASGPVPSAFNAQVIFDNGDTYTGQWVIQTLRRTGNYNEAETYDVTLESSGVSFSPGS